MSPDERGSNSTNVAATSLLLRATRGSSDAYANVNKAVVLVLEFVGDVDFGGNSYKNQMENNAKAFNDFISFLGIKDEENAYDDKRKISCDINGRTIDVWFKKMSISISKDDYSYSLK